MTDYSLGLIGISHKAAPLAVREHLALPPHARSQFFAKARASLNGLAVLSTCNRVEFYGHADGRGSADEALQFLLNTSFDLSSAHPYLYRKRAGEVPRHLMRVACGLDSMVLGEPQILGQVSACLRSAETASLASPKLNAIFQAAVKAGKRARKETALGRFPVSVASVAIDRIRVEAGPLNHLHVAVLGTGEMGSLAGKILRKEVTARLTFVNRSLERAEALAADACAQAMPLEELRAAIAQADVLISATDAPHLVVETEHISPRTDRPLLLVDLAVPRDIDPAVNQLPNVKLLDVDHLRTDIAQSKAARQAEIPQVEEIIERELDLLDRRLRTLEVEPIITGLRQKAESIRQAELARTLAALGPLDPQVVQQLEHFSTALVNKLLHEPTLRLRKDAEDDGNPELDSHIIRRLFDLQNSALNE